MYFNSKLNPKIANYKFSPNKMKTTLRKAKKLGFDLYFRATSISNCPPKYLRCGAFSTACLDCAPLQPCQLYELLQHCEQKVHIIVDF